MRRPDYWVRWRALPSRLKLGLLIAALALAGLTWQHYAADSPPRPAGRGESGRFRRCRPRRRRR